MVSLNVRGKGCLQPELFTALVTFMRHPPSVHEFVTFEFAPGRELQPTLLTFVEIHVGVNFCVEEERRSGLEFLPAQLALADVPLSVLFWKVISIFNKG